MQTLPSHNVIPYDVGPSGSNAEAMHVVLEERPNGSPERRELVTITVTKEDFRKLKADGALRTDQVRVALRRYLHIKEKARRGAHIGADGWSRGPVVSFSCAMPKTLTDQIRSLGGRFDSHTIEAVRLFFLAKADAANNVPQEIHSGPTLHRSLWSTAFGALSFLVSRFLGQPL
jgi:hypothetical protein